MTAKRKSARLGTSCATTASNVSPIDGSATSTTTAGMGQTNQTTTVPTATVTATPTSSLNATMKSTLDFYCFSFKNCYKEMNHNENKRESLDKQLFYRVKEILCLRNFRNWWNILNTIFQRKVSSQFWKKINHLHRTVENCEDRRREFIFPTSLNALFFAWIIPLT